GQPYDLATINLPAGSSDVSFTGVKDAQGNLPLINLDEVKIEDLIFGSFSFENLQMRAGGTKSKYLFNIGSAGLKVKEFNFIGCDIENYRSLVRTTADNIEFGKLNFDNCLMNNMGGYGVVNINRSSVKTDSIVFKNSTLTNLETQLMDVRTKVGYIFIGNCTFYNQNVAMAQLFRFDKNNLPVIIETNANIISGNNSGAKINSVSDDMPDLSFGGSYRTNELIINQREFNNITVFEGSADDLFIDPSNRNFTVKPESGFGGRGTAGDPRWFK